MIKNRIFYVLIFLLISLNSCTSVKEGLSPNKRQGDEFLVKKKNPLVLPPDFEDLPTPNEDSKNVQKNDEDLDIKKMIGSNSIKDSTNSPNSKKSKLEELILEKINEN